MNPRKITLSTNLVIYAGRDAENNDELVRKAGKSDIILHTEAAGSPFVNVGSESTKEEINEAAIYCVKYSKEWKNKKSDTSVNLFIRRDMKKGLFMKKGTWLVKKQKKIKVKKIDILKLERKLKDEK